MNASNGAGGGDDEELVDKPSVIRLLRVFVGAVERQQPDSQPPPTQLPTSAIGEATSGESPTSRKRPRISAPRPAPQPRASNNSDDGGSLDGNDLPQTCNLQKVSQHKLPPRLPSPPAHGVEDSASARIDAGCTLWDMSVEETYAAVMFESGLIPIAMAVLQYCTQAGLAVSGFSTASEGEEIGAVTGGATAKVKDAGGGESDELRGAGVETEGECIDNGVLEVERLREVTCGLLANACSHRNLRQHFFRDAALSEELLEAFHSIDDPGCLTELLRLFSIVARTATPVACDGHNTRAQVALAEGLVATETLHRLGMFLENSLEEKLLAQVCSLVYSLMYRFGDDVISPLVGKYRLEESLASLLATRSTDLSYERAMYYERALCLLLQFTPGDRKQVGGAETGLDCLLRCLEVLSTNEMSSIGPYSPGRYQPTAIQTTMLEGEQASSMAAFEGKGATDPTAAPANGDALGPDNRDVVASVSNTAQHKAIGVSSGAGPTTPVGGTEAFENNYTADQTAPMIPPVKDGKWLEKKKRGDFDAFNLVFSDPSTPVVVDVMDKGCGRRGGIRGNVIRGLARILEPWEYVRQTQVTALLVLGNVLENVLEAEAGGLAAEQASARIRECAIELEKGVTASGSGGDPRDEDGADGQRDSDDGRRRTADFLKNVADLVGMQDSSAPEQDIGRELVEASAILRKVLKISSLQA